MSSHLDFCKPVFYFFVFEVSLGDKVRHLSLCIALMFMNKTPSPPVLIVVKLGFSCTCWKWRQDSWMMKGQGHSCRELLPALRRHCPTSFLVLKLGEGMWRRTEIWLAWFSGDSGCDPVQTAWCVSGPVCWGVRRQEMILFYDTSTSV